MCVVDCGMMWVVRGENVFWDWDRVIGRFVEIKFGKFKCIGRMENGLFWCFDKFLIFLFIISVFDDEIFFIFKGYLLRF